MKEQNKAREKRYLAKVKTRTEMKIKMMVLFEECSSFPRSFQSLLTLLLCFSFVMGSPLSLGFFIFFLLYFLLRFSILLFLILLFSLLFSSLFSASFFLSSFWLIVGLL
jgi:hypothetical protein